MIRYYCIQVRGQATFPYGKAGPIRTLTEARRALRMLRHDFPARTWRLTSAPGSSAWGSWSGTSDSPPSEVSAKPRRPGAHPGRRFRLSPSPPA